MLEDIKNTYPLLDNRDRIIEAISSSVINIFAEMSFMDVVVIGSPIEININDFLVDSEEYEIDIIKPFKATLTFFIPEKLKLIFAENTLGVPQSELNINNIDDSILELVNVVAGSFLEKYLEKGIHSVIGIPQLVVEKEENEVHDGIFLQFSTEEIRFDVFLKIKAKE